jgi:hypothetical protein
VYYEPSGFLGLGKVEMKQQGSVLLTPGKLLSVAAAERMANPEGDGFVYPFNVETPSRMWHLYANTPEVRSTRPVPCPVRFSGASRPPSRCQVS